MGKVIINPLNFAWTLIHRSYFSLLFRSSNKPDFYIDSTKWFFSPLSSLSPPLSDDSRAEIFETRANDTRGEEGSVY